MKARTKLLATLSSISLLGCTTLISLPTSAFAATNSVVVPSDLLPMPANATQLGQVNGQKKMFVSIVLKPQAGLTQAVHQMLNTPIQDRTKLTPEEFAAKFGNQQMSTVTAYLQAFGLQVKEQPGGLSLTVSGNASQMEKAFGVTFETIKATVPGYGAKTFYRAQSQPKLPSAIASQIEVLAGMTNEPTVHPLLTRATGSNVGSSATQYPDEGGTPLDYLPNDIQSAYNVNQVYQDGYLGQGETIGIMTLSTFNPNDTETFWQNTNLPAMPTLHVTDVDWATSTGNTIGSDESTLDSSESGAMAPGATIDEYVGYTPSNAGMLQTFQAIVSQDTADVISSSWGAPEDDMTTDYMNALNDVFKQAVLQGQTILQASGDTGAYSDPNSSSPVALFPATSPYVTAAGGTTLLLADDSRVSETAWSYLPVAGSDTGGSGGGYSTFFAEPSWQLNAGIPDPTRMRGVPDVALNANPETGYQIYYQGEWQNGWGGTSFAAPEWAGFTALMDQAIGKRMGNMNQMIYSLAQTTAYPSSFYDITQGTNGAYNAGPGWSAVTGWGTPNVAGLITAIQGPLPMFENMSAAQTSLPKGQSTTVTVTVTDTRGQGISGQQVVLTSDSTNATISNGGYATTNANGQATFTVSDPTAESVDFTAADNTACNVNPQDVVITWQ